MELKGNTDIEKAIFLLREIDAWLSLNQEPTKEQLRSMKKSIKEFTSHFPDCWNCGDTGYVSPDGSIPCACNEDDVLCII